jgi:L-rhamnose isomerase
MKQYSGGDAMAETSLIESNYKQARERYGEMGVDTEKALSTLEKMSLSLHCWQGDDVGGFEAGGGTLSGGGIQATGNYPGRARTPDELRMDLEKAFEMIPGPHRLNLHASYGEFKERDVDRDEIEPAHFQGWIDWARKHQINLDFNSTYFSHPKADAGYTLSSKDDGIRAFWVEHAKRCREIGAHMGRELGNPCIHNIWIPDGAKDITVDRWKHRELLKNALDEVFEKPYDPKHMKDAVECKLFGIGSESFVVGSHEFYLGYALTGGKMLCIDLGHFHPTESVSDKLSSILLYTDELLLHVSRGVRWDSDHVVIMNDDVRHLAEEIVRGNVMSRVHVATDFFDASMNRVGAWVIGSRSTIKCFLAALLEPRKTLMSYEEGGDYFSRLALLEEMKTMPLGAVWDYYCLRSGVQVGMSYIDKIQQYERKVLRKRDA